MACCPALAYGHDAVPVIGTAAHKNKEAVMLRWLGILAFLATITGLITIGVIPTEAVGLGRTLFEVYIGLLAVSLCIAIIKT